MHYHPAFSPGNVAVITGGADGIGLACARKLLELGMQVCVSDIDAGKLEAAAAGLGDVLAVAADVSSLEAVEHLRDAVLERFGKVHVLLNNAGTGLAGNGSWTEYQSWLTTLNVNLFGVINGIHSFVPAMLEQGEAGAVINTGSKQGITLPPGNPAYNVSKAGVKAITEMLAHSLRITEGCRISAHLLVPGFTYSGMLRQFLPEKPDGAWTPEQVADFMVEHVSAGDFYILCPDNDTTREIDNKRMEWAMGDLIHNRPALSRWHDAYTQAFEQFMER